MKANYIASYLLFFLFYIGCKEPFNPPAIVDTQHYLVVEGYINAGDGPTIIMLTRTRNLSDTGTIRNASGVPDSILVTDALVWVEDQQGEASPLEEFQKGEYGGRKLFLDDSKEYRLHIKTKDGKEYASDYVSVVKAPAVENIHWHVVHGDGIHIEANVSANGDETRYFRWTYSETWEFHVNYLSKYWYDKEDSILRMRTTEQLVYRCWQTDRSHDILIATSENLGRNELKGVGLTVVPYHDEKASVLYSIQVNQMGISEAEYEFWLKMKKNTESLGSLFDPQPSNAKGNIRNLSDPKEPVIGYVGIHDVVKKRIFIANDQLPPDWIPTWSKCELIPVIQDSMWFYYGHNTYTPVDESHGTYNSCADCTTRGTTIKPSFWP